MTRCNSPCDHCPGEDHFNRYLGYIMTWRRLLGLRHTDLRGPTHCFSCNHSVPKTHPPGMWPFNDRKDLDPRKRLLDKNAGPLANAKPNNSSAAERKPHPPLRNNLATKAQQDSYESCYPDRYTLFVFYDMRESFKELATRCQR